MQHLVVAIRPDADDSIAPVSTSVLHRFEIQPHVPAVLEIWRTQPSNELMGSCFVAIEADTAIATSHTIVVGADLAACLHLATDDEIIAKPCHHVRSADLVFVVPTTTDDYEIIESNQALVERVVLRQLRVVYSGMQCCIHLTPTLKVHLTVEGVGVPARERVCFEIAEGTELAIKTKRRPKGGPSRDPRPAMLANLSLVPAPSAAEITRRCTLVRETLGTLFAPAAVTEKYGWAPGDVQMVAARIMDSMHLWNHRSRECRMRSANCMV